MISPRKIFYNGKSNFSFPTFDLLCDLAFDSDSGGSSSGLNREIIASESYNGKLKYSTGSKYSEVLSPQITLIKSDYSDLTLSEQRQILSWLTGKSTPSFMDIYDDPDSTVVTYSLLGLPTQIETYKLSNNRTVGITFTFECVSPFAFSPLKTITRTITEPTTMTITSNTDDYNDVIYPKISITTSNTITVPCDNANILNESGSDITSTVYTTSSGTVYHYKQYAYIVATEYDEGETYYTLSNDTYTKINIEDSNDFSSKTTGDNAVILYKYGYQSFTNQLTRPNLTGFSGSVRIYNNTLGTYTYLAGIGTNETNIIDGQNKVIYCVGNSSRIYGDKFYWKWLPLKYGDNSIKILAPAGTTVTFEWREPMKVGELI